MSIAAVLDKLVEIEEDLSISDPEPMSVKRAIDSYPDSNQGVPDSDLPAWMHEWEVSEGTWLAGGAREITYIIHLMLLVGDTNTELNKRMRIATRFFEALVNALDDNIGLGNTDLHMEPQRARQGLLRVLGRAYVGLEVWLEVKGVGTAV